MTSRRIAALVLLVLDGVWILVNGPAEGATLGVVTPGHGLTVADLPALAAGGLAVVLLVSTRR